MEVGNRKD
uniref:Uncharacterized protein n=1 Tax=Anguilla anguilla TaxID=7936 RepID=A0A0E9THG8_ANGAN